MGEILLENIKTKKVFISYSWSNEEHKEKVIRLAEELVNLGIDVILDEWDLKPGQDKYEFMEQIVTDSSLDKVLIITDRVYAEKANKRQGGVGAETQIITPSLYEDLGENKFIPIIFEKDENTGKAFLPTYVKSRIYIDLSSDQVYQQGLEQLVRDIYEKPLRTKPKLGKAPSYIVEDRINTFKIERKADDVEYALSKGTKRVVFALKDYFDIFIEELDKLEVKENSGESYDAAALRMVDESLPFRQSFVKVLNVFVQEESVDSEFISEFFEDFYNKIMQMETQDMLAPEAAKFLLTELFIYTTSVFIKFKRWDNLSNILNHIFYSKSERNNFYFVALRIPPRIILGGEIQRGSGRVSIIAEKMEKRTTEKEFNSMIEADMFLYYVSKINPLIDTYTWFPILYIFLDRLNGNIKVLTLLKNKSNLRSLLPIFGVSQVDLTMKISSMNASPGYPRAFKQIPAFQSFIKSDEIGVQP
ncbi:TIR domain-containing protein [Enterococcus hirae]|nr:TIR domain-containing protein [Enterococcus hirae]EMF0231945.1 TIR domain-containing protein [Enterococcus hirae]